MSLTIQIHEAAHAWGMDHYYQLTARNGFGMQPSVGTALLESTSWGEGDPPLGVLVHASVQMSSGITIEIGFRVLDLDAAEIQSVAFLASTTRSPLITISGSIPADEAALDSFDSVSVLAGADHLMGNSHGNVLHGGGGNDVINGGGGTDTAVFSGHSSTYAIQRNGTTITVSGAEGMDTLQQVERLSFSDKMMAFDLSGTAGQAYRLYQAAFDRTPDANGLGFQVRALDSSSLNAVAANFLASPEFSRTYGALDNRGFVNKLYDNVLDRPGEESGVSYHMAALAGGMNRAQLLINFSESPENQASVLGAIQNGISYPY